jgi:hypothetical protein
MTKTIVLAFPALLVACAGAQLTPAVSRGAKLETMKQVQAALGRGGHACELDADGDLLCDADKKDASTVLVSFHSGAGGLHLTFLSAFPWKRTDPCADVAKAVNQFNADAFSYHAACTQKGLVLLTMLVVPENGLTDHDVQAFYNWWGPSSVQLAGASPMAAELK